MGKSFRPIQYLNYKNINNIYKEFNSTYILMDLSQFDMIQN